MGHADSSLLTLPALNSGMGFAKEARDGMRNAGLSIAN
jgi:hypothetical protein